MIYGRKRSLLIGVPLRILSGVYHLLVLLRHALYRAGVLRTRNATQRVISVGNITLGGTGKTPTVLNIASLLQKHAVPPVVVSRGYGRTNEAEILIVSDGKNVLADTRGGGDEPVLIASRLTGVPVVAGSDRLKAAAVAFEAFGNRVVVLDDGFQHLRLHRDLDIVLIHAADPFGNGNLFPAGILREPLSSLKRAHVVMITGSDRAGDLTDLKDRIRSRTNAKLFTSRQVPLDLFEIKTGEIKALTALHNTPVLAVAGIARPASFFSTLRSLGADVRSEAVFPDHYRYGNSDLAGLFQQAADKKISMIVTTEKDAVRLKELNPDGLWALRIELQVVENEEWEKAVLDRT